MTIKGINHITLIVTDIPKAVYFFEILGFKPKEFQQIGGADISRIMDVENPGQADHHSLSLCPDDDESTEIQLLHYKGIKHLPNPTAEDGRSIHIGFDHVAFTVENLDNEVARLKEYDIKFITEKFTVGKKHLIFFEGIDGVTFELAEIIQ